MGICKVYIIGIQSTLLQQMNVDYCSIQSTHASYSKSTLWALQEDGGERGTLQKAGNKWKGQKEKNRDGREGRGIAARS